MALRTPIKIPDGVRVLSEPPIPFVRRPAPVTNALLLGQQLAEALGAARALINRTPPDPTLIADQLRREYYGHDPALRDRLLWRHFDEAKRTCDGLEQAIHVAREALTVERDALSQAEAEYKALATHTLPVTVEVEATGIRQQTVHRYRTISAECQERQAAIADLERLLPAPEQILPLLLEATARVLEAVGTVDREAIVLQVRESHELGHLRARFERLRMLARTHEGEIDEWSRRLGRPLRIPRVVFPWPPPEAWDALLSAPTEAPKLIWDDDPRSPSP